MDIRKNSWNTYQKDIANNNFYYARSCIRQNFYPASEYTFLDILKNLDIYIYDDPNHTTCTGIGYHADVVPFDTIQTVIARHFALMKEAYLKNIAISCVTSFGLYTEVLETWKHNPEQLEKIRNFLYTATKREFDIPENVAHTS